ncbi:MAG: hypothetical protein Q7T53_08975 [Deltaproteobacteria bacterium]|nr:hypothetical protein [Deltaproteobacteria bacterium]
MPKKTEEKKETAGRLGVPPVRETYQEMKGSKKVEDEVEKRERRREEKVHEHLEHEKVKGYKEHLPPVEDRIKTERPPFK